MLSITISSSGEDVVEARLGAVGEVPAFDEEPRSSVAIDSTRCASVISFRRSIYFICFFTLGIWAIAYSALKEFVDEVGAVNGFTPNIRRSTNRYQVPRSRLTRGRRRFIAIWRVLKTHRWCCDSRLNGAWEGFHKSSTDGVKSNLTDCRFGRGKRGSRLYNGHRSRWNTTPILLKTSLRTFLNECIRPCRAFRVAGMQHNSRSFGKMGTSI